VFPLRGELREPFRHVAAVTLAMALAACEPPTDPIQSPQRRLLIHAVLDADALAQTIKVQYIDGSFGHSPVGVSGASVQITAPTGAVFGGVEDTLQNGFPQIIYRVENLGRDNPVHIVPGGTYTLRVRTPAGEEASGTTTMPAFTALPDRVVVFPSFDRERDTLRMNWRRVPLAARYEVVIQSIFRFEDQILIQTYKTFADTSVTMAGTARTLDNERVFSAGSTARVLVAAVDDNYYRYYHATVDPFAGAPPTRLIGAIGVFGSIVPLGKREYTDVQ
jgi:hypothetical protein